jgi:TetR/AcrR family transcriptional repressor of mexJK operon
VTLDNHLRSPESRPGATTPELSPQRRRGGRVTEKRRQEIVKHAARLFLEHGYERVTIDDIVAQVGGSKRTLYARFGGKVGLFETVIRDLCTSVTRDLVVDVDPDDTLEEQLVAIGTKFLKLILDPRILEQHRLMVSMGRRFPSLAQMFFKSGPMTAYEIVADWVRRQQTAGKLAAADPAQLAALFLDMLTGKHQLARLTSTPSVSRPQDIAETVRAAAALFLRGAESQPSPLP